MMRHKVPPRAAPNRLDRYLTSVFPHLSRAKIQKLILKGAVFLAPNGKPVTFPSYFVKPGQNLWLNLPSAQETAAAAAPIRGAKAPKLDILHEDEWLLVIEKPAGLVVHPGAGHSEGTLIDALTAHEQHLAK